MTDQPDAVPAPVPEGGARRSRGRTVLWVVLALLALVAVAVGGVAYGRASAPGPDIVVQPEPVMEESPGVSPMPVASLPSVPTASASPSVGTPVLTVGTSAQPASWPVVLTPGAGLPDTATVASGYRLAASGISGPQVASVLAGTFGITGQPLAQDGAWVVGTAGGPTLTVNDDPLVSWVYEDPTVQASPATGEQLEPARAIELASALLGSIGVDTTSVDWQVDRYFGRTAAIAWQLVGGSRTQLSWQVAFDPSGDLVQASGFSAGIEEVPGYPVLGAASAVTRSTSSPWSAIGPTFISGPAATGPPASPGPSPRPSATPSALDRPAVTVPVTTATVADATLGLAQYWQPDGGVLMLPSYTLTAEDGSRWSLLAVDEPYVQFADQPYPIDVLPAS